MSRAVLGLLPAAVFVAALFATASARDERTPDPAPPARAANLRAPASEARPAPSPPVLVDVREIPAPLATPEPGRTTARAPARHAPTPMAPVIDPQPTPSPAPAVRTPAPATPAPAAPAPPSPSPPIPAPTFDDSGSGPGFDDEGAGP